MPEQPPHPLHYERPKRPKRTLEEKRDLAWLIVQLVLVLAAPVCLLALLTLFALCGPD